MTVTVQKIASLRATVAVVSPREPYARLIEQALRQVGFSRIHSYASLNDLETDLESIEMDWVITGLEDKSSVNALRFLQTLTQEPRLQHIRVSLMLTERELPCLTSAFELGLLSWHEGEYALRPLIATFKNLLRVFEDVQAREPYVAAHYFRHFLKSYHVYDELVNLEQTLASAYYGDSANYLRLAEAHFLAGDAKKGRLTLSEIENFDPVVADQAASLYTTYVGQLYDDVASFAEKFGLRDVVVIDSDRKSANIHSLALSRIGVMQTQIFEDGQAAWDAMKRRPEPDLIIMEWRIAGLSGPYLMQRIRSHGFKKVPVVVASQHITRGDAQLLKDMSVAQVLSKPLREKQILMTLAWVVTQHRTPTEAKAVERKIIESLGSGDFATALALKDRFMKNPKASAARKCYVEGAFYYHEARYYDAVDMLTQSIQHHEGDNVDVVALLGKSLARLGDHATAAIMLERASRLSPKNIARLCDLAEVRLEGGNAERARESIQAAMSLDAGSDRVTQVRTKFAIATGETDEVRNLIRSLDSWTDILGFTNNLAVSKAKTGNTEEGIRLYGSLLELIPGDRGEYRGIVLYNNALAHLRNEDVESAMAMLQQAVAAGTSRVQVRAQTLYDRLEKAVKEGRKPRLVQGEEEEAKSLEDRIFSGIERYMRKADKDQESNAMGLYPLYRALHVGEFAGRLLMRDVRKRVS